MHCVLLKYLFIPIIIVAACKSPLSLAADVSLAWNAVDQATGYNVYYGFESRNYTFVADVGGSTECSISNLEEDQLYYISVKAYNNYTESDFSKELVISASVCGTDLDTDSDTDGADLDTFMSGATSLKLGVFATKFGQTNCAGINYYYVCDTDLDADGDTDGSDLHTYISGEKPINLNAFASKFGQTNCVVTTSYAIDVDGDQDVDGVDLVDYTTDPADISLKDVAAVFGKTNLAVK